MVNVNIKKFSRSKVESTPDDVKPDEPIEVKEDDNDFLNDLHKSNYTSAIEEQKNEEENKKDSVKLLKEKEKIEKQREKENEKFEKQREKENIKLLKELETKNKKMTKRVIDNDTDSIFSDEGTAILGKNKNILLKKVRKFKNLFPEELKKFKIKANPTEQELKNYLEEMEILVELNNVDDFLTDSIVQSLKLIENFTAHTKKYNIVGLSEMLKNNPQFHNLCKQLYIKYNTFSCMPPEYQMLFLVSTTAYICRNKNIQKNEIEQYLNQEIKINT